MKNKCYVFRQDRKWDSKPGDPSVVIDVPLDQLRFMDDEVGVREVGGHEINMRDHAGIRLDAIFKFEGWYEARVLDLGYPCELPSTTRALHQSEAFEAKRIIWNQLISFINAKEGEEVRIELRFAPVIILVKSPFIPASYRSGDIIVPVRVRFEDRKVNPHEKGLKSYMEMMGWDHPVDHIEIDHPLPAQVDDSSKQEMKWCDFSHLALALSTMTGVMQFSPGALRERLVKAVMTRGRPILLAELPVYGIKVVAELAHNMNLLARVGKQGAVPERKRSIIQQFDVDGRLFLHPLRTEPESTLSTVRIAFFLPKNHGKHAEAVARMYAEALVNKLNIMAMEAEVKELSKVS